MTDEQFEKMIMRLEDRRSENFKSVIEAFLPAREDRDRLIRMEGQIDAATRMMAAMRSEDLVKIEEASRRGAAAHRRLDTQFIFMLGTGIITIGGMLLTALFVYIRMGAPS